MSWRDFALARKYLVETRIGTRVREAKHREDRLAQRNREALERQERKRGPRRDR